MTGAWSPLRDHPMLDGLAWPGVSEDGLEINAPVRASGGQLHRATRDSIDDEFGAPSIVAFESPFDGGRIVDPHLSTDGRTLVVSVHDGTRFNLHVGTR